MLEGVPGLAKTLAIKTLSDATIIVPLIKDYLEISVKNDDALVKLSAVVQRLITASGKGDDTGEFGLSAEERNKLLAEAEAEMQKLQNDNSEDIDENIIPISTGNSDRPANSV